MIFLLVLSFDSRNGTSEITMQLEAVSIVGSW